MLQPQTRMLIDALPFTTEGYARAKTILETKYGNVSEIINAHIKEIMALPTVSGTNPKRIMEFYEALIRNVRPWENSKET